MMPYSAPVAPSLRSPAADGTRSNSSDLAGIARSRDPDLREKYISTALAHIPRLLGALDRNPYRPTYGCFDREFWHYRTTSFASEMYQEAVLPLAFVYAVDFPENRWRGDSEIRKLAVAALEFSARNSHPDGSCDDYYPFERALGAAVFSLQAAAKACLLLGLDSANVVESLERRARWIMRSDESGRLANHHALAALALARVAQLTGRAIYRTAAEERIRRVLAWQSSEGWFEEYGGADPGYQTVTIDCLAKLRQMWNAGWLCEPLARAVRFAGLFLHQDGSYGGEYGSRGTCHFYPHGFELLAGGDATAARLADGFLRALVDGTQARFDDDRMYAHRIANLIEAYLDWQPSVPRSGDDAETEARQFLPEAGLLVRNVGGAQTVASAARGGVFKHFSGRRLLAADAGLIIETNAGIAVSQSHDRGRRFEASPVADECDRESYRVSLSLHWTRFETATPVKQAVLQLGMISFGRWCRTLVRRILQRRVITGRCEAPIRLTRTIEFLGGELTVTDKVELLAPSLQVKRMHFACDLQTAYVAAANVYQSSSLYPWTDLNDRILELNERRQVTIVRTF